MLAGSSLFPDFICDFRETGLEGLGYGDFPKRSCGDR